MQIKASGVNRTHDPHANSLAHLPVDYHCTLHQFIYSRTFKLIYYTKVLSLSSAIEKGLYSIWGYTFKLDIIYVLFLEMHCYNLPLNKLADKLFYIIISGQYMTVVSIKLKGGPSYR